MATVTEPRLHAPFTWANEHIAADLGHAQALFTTRRGGVSPPPYATLNLGRLTADTDANVDANRDRVAAATGCPRANFLYGRQVHGTRVRRATEPPGRQRGHAEEDGQATALRRHPALVFTADCLPILLAADGAVAAIHAGWRGLAGGILDEGIAAVRELGATGPITALIGPGARGCCYEVGEEVHEEFAAYDARRGNRNLDLAAVAKAQLGPHADVHDTGLCTMCHPALFFSHRRDNGITGRQAGVVWRS